jgi:MFS family permease
LLVGAATAAIFAPMMATVTGWFETHRSLAVSLVSAGMGMAPMTMSPLVAWLVQSHDWRTTMQILAVVVASIMIPVALLVRRPPALAGATAASGDAGPQSDVAFQALQSPQFINCLRRVLLCAHSSPIIHAVVPSVAAFDAGRGFVYSVEGRGIGHRIAFGPRRPPGAKRVLVLGLLARRSLRWPMSSCANSPAFYAVAAFRLHHAGVMPLYAVLAREIPVEDDGRVISGTAMAGSLGMATGPVAGRLIDLRQLRVAVYRRVGHGPWRVPDGHELSAVSQSAGRASAGVIRQLHGLNAGFPVVHVSPQSCAAGPSRANCWPATARRTCTGRPSWTRAEVTRDLGRHPPVGSCRRVLHLKAFATSAFAKSRPISPFPYPDGPEQLIEHLCWGDP